MPAWTGVVSWPWTRMGKGQLRRTVSFWLIFGITVGLTWFNPLWCKMSQQYLVLMSVSSTANRSGILGSTPYIELLRVKGVLPTLQVSVACPLPTSLG